MEIDLLEVHRSAEPQAERILHDPRMREKARDDQPEEHRPQRADDDESERRGEVEIDVEVQEEVRPVVRDVFAERAVRRDEPRLILLLRRHRHARHRRRRQANVQMRRRRREPAEHGGDGALHARGIGRCSSWASGCSQRSHS